jgi:2-polyprenyl-3-methyl-5-hydroxy-6-metoxy-1,4-benzoquinol methylase
MQHAPCSVCGEALGEPLYTSGNGQSLTSLCRIHPGQTRVFVCRNCGHLQTSAIADVNGYYDSQYDILVESEEEDQIYEIRDSKTTFRTEHQVKVLLEKLEFQRHVDLLDYGCAKSSTIRALCAVAPSVTPHAFDVSARYVPFWEKFVAPGNWAVNSTKEEWNSRFDVVTSFFSMEHIPAVADSVRTITNLLKPGGVFYFVVPNVFSNSADFIVVDHCNHFTPSSLGHLLTNAGLRVRDIDDSAHRGAFVVVAEKPSDGAVIKPQVSRVEIERTCDELSAIAEFWRNAAVRIRAYESGLKDGRQIAVYGAGFYAAFITAALAKPARIACYLDQNPFLQGKVFNDQPVLPPADLPNDLATLLVGLNPAHARTIIADIPALSRRKLDYFYL